MASALIAEQRQLFVTECYTAYHGLRFAYRRELEPAALRLFEALETAAPRLRIAS